MKKDQWMKLLWYPDPKTRVKTRWWWYGCRADRADIIYQLDQMHQAGIGGVELQITYPLQAGDDNYAYFSPEYFQILQFTAEELKKRGMTLDLTLGSSWPYGGPFVPFAKSAVHVVPLELTVEGPQTYSCDFTNRITGEVIGCVMGQMQGSEMDPKTITDLRPYLADKLLYEWPWGTQLSEVPVPEGVWKIVIFAASQFREHVLMPTRGAEGYVIDHNNREAMRFFLEHAGTPLARRLGPGTVEHFFCDSLEVFGHNWAIGLYDAFRSRRGYDLHPYIYALWGEVKGLTDQIRYDFHKTLSELTVEGFFRELTAWCHEVGSKSRIQAHGTWGDVLLAYAAADVPEGETFSAWDKFSVNTVHRRLAASAGHLYDRPVISNESFTWLRFPRFTETPEQIKIAADSIFVDGINQIVNHGYSYAPDPSNRQGKEPLYFYAASNISHTNTWWSYYPHLAAYMHRVSAFLQLGRPAAQICIYLPQADVWAENPLSDLHMCMKLEEKLQTACVDAIAHAGYWFDYINDDAIAQGRLGGYEALLLLETVRMPQSSAEAIAAYAGEGGKVICAGPLPSADCGKEGRFDVAGLFAGMQRAGKLRQAADKWQSLVDCLRETLTPALYVTTGGEDIGYVQRDLSDAKTDSQLYFVANMSLHSYDTTLVFRKAAKTPLVLDPLTGREVELKADAFEPDIGGGGASLRLYFPPGQSYLVVFGWEEAFIPAVCRHIDTQTEAAEKETGKRTALQRVYEPMPAPRRQVDLSDGWQLEAPQISYRGMQDHAAPVHTMDDLRYFSGEVIYRREISVSARDLLAKEIVLTVEEVHTCGQVLVNGHVVTDWIMRPWEARIGSHLREGNNVIEIKVATPLINRFLDPAYELYQYPDQLLDVWPYFPQQLIKERGKRLDAWREREMVKEPLPAGLEGAVRLAFYGLPE